MVLVSVDPGNSNLNSKFTADGYRGSAICMISPMVGYGGHGCDRCCEFATDTRRVLMQLRISGKSRQNLNSIELGLQIPL